jgi:phosphomannomutase
VLEGSRQRCPAHDKIAIGGEESAGLTICGRVPEKDGFIAGLLMAEMMATRGTSLSAQLMVLFAKVGSFYPTRENFHLTAEQKAAFTEKLKADPRELGGRKVTNVVRTDGLKLIPEDGGGCAQALRYRTGSARVYRDRSENQMQTLGTAAEKFDLS